MFRCSCGADDMGLARQIHRIKGEIAEIDKALDLIYNEPGLVAAARVLQDARRKLKAKL